MAEFEVEGNILDTNNFSEDQDSLINSLSITKELIAELTKKHELFLSEKESIEKGLEEKFGSKIKQFSETSSGVYVTLSSGKKKSLSELDDQVANLLKKLLFLNDQLNYYQNQLQVLDTAKITYSKIFYQTIKGAE